MKRDYFVKALQDELESKKDILDTAYKAQVLSSEVGFDFESINDAFEKFKEECKEIEEAFYHLPEDKEHFIEEIGDGIFALINLARFMGVSPTNLLYQTTKKYLSRVDFIEQELKKEGASWRDKSFKELDKLWDKAKEDNL